MNSIASPLRLRGLRRVYLNGAGGAPSAAAVLAELNSAFTDFRSRNSSRVEALEKEQERVNGVLAAMRVGGIGDGLGGPSATSRVAIEALGRFAKTGDPSAMMVDGPQAKMSTQSDPDGGYLVPDEVSKTIYSLQRNISPFRRLARVVPTSRADYKHPVNKGGTASGWVGEESARPETDGAQLAMISFPAGEIYANPAVTQTLLDDADFNVGQFVVEEISKEFEEKEGAAFITGNGINKPRGFLTYSVYIGAGNAAYGSVQAIKTGAAGGFLTASATVSPADVLIDMLHSLKAAHRQKATWLMNSSTQAVVSKFKDADGAFIWQRSTALGVPDTLLGRPVELDENMPDVVADALPVALGNWNDAYLINDRMGVRMLRDPYTNKPNVHFYTTKRVGGGLLDAEALKVLKVAE